MSEDYNSEEARTQRSAALHARAIISEFGDPNSEDYRDPYARTSTLVFESSDVVGHHSHSDVWELAQGDPRAAAEYAERQERGVPTSPKFRDVRNFEEMIEG